MWGEWSLPTAASHARRQHTTLPAAKAAAPIKSGRHPQWAFQKGPRHHSYCRAYPTLAPIAIIPRGLRRASQTLTDLHAMYIATPSHRAPFVRCFCDSSSCLSRIASRRLFTLLSEVHATTSQRPHSHWSDPRRHQSQSQSQSPALLLPMEANKVLGVPVPEVRADTDRHRAIVTHTSAAATIRRPPWEAPSPPAASAAVAVAPAPPPPAPPAAATAWRPPVPTAPPAAALDAAAAGPAPPAPASPAATAATQATPPPARRGPSHSQAVARAHATADHRAGRFVPHPGAATASRRVGRRGHRSSAASTHPTRPRPWPRGHPWRRQRQPPRRPPWLPPQGRVHVPAAAAAMAGRPPMAAPPLAAALAVVAAAPAAPSPARRARGHGRAAARGDATAGRCVGCRGRCSCAAATRSRDGSASRRR